MVPTGVSGRLLEAVRRGELVAVVSWDLTDADIDDVVAVLGPLLPDVDVAVEVRDPDDAAVVGAALAGAAAAIVTGDRDLFQDADLRAWLAARRVARLAPAALLERLSGGGIMSARTANPRATLCRDECETGAGRR